MSAARFMIWCGIKNSQSRLLHCETLLNNRIYYRYVMADDAGGAMRDSPVA